MIGQNKLGDMGHTAEFQTAEYHPNWKCTTGMKSYLGTCVCFKVRVLANIKVYTSYA